VAVAWAAFQPRTVALAAALGGDALLLTSRLGPRAALLPLRYLDGAVRTWRHLERRRPACVVVVTPPVTAPLVAWLWCRLRARPLVVDCHTDTFHGSRWRWARPLHRWLLRRSRAALVHTEEALELVEGWDVPALLLPDDVPDAVGAAAGPSPEPSARPTVLVAGSLDDNEPVADVLAAAALLPVVEFRVTGDPGRLPAGVRESAPANVVLTGFLAYPAFLAAMAAADTVAVFSTDPHIMNRAAFEAVGLGRPLVLSDLPGLRRRFGGAALFADNRPPEMAEALRRALAGRETLAERSRALADDLRRQHTLALERLRALLAERGRAPARRRVLRITQHPFPADSIVRRDVLELAGRGFEVDVVCAAGPRRDDVLPAGSGAIRVHRIPIRHRRGSTLRYPLEYAAFFLAATAVAGALGLRRRYAVVQVDNLPDLLVFAAAVPRLRGARLVLTLYELTPEMVAARFTGRLGRLLTGVARTMEAAAVRWADHVIAISEPCRQVLRARGVPDERMTVVLNTTPWNGSRPEPSPERARTRVLITHTTLVERYGVQVAVEALALLRPRRPDLTLEVVGGGEQLPELVRLAAELGVDQQIVFTGQLPWSETLARVSRARLGIVPLLADGYGELMLPTKLLEYAWLGVPAVCSRLPAIQAYFPPEAVAYAAPGDPRELADQIDRLLRQPERTERQAALASRIARRLAWEEVRPHYLAALGLDATAGSGTGAATASEPAPRDAVAG